MIGNALLAVIALIVIVGAVAFRNIGAVLVVGLIIGFCIGKDSVRQKLSGYMERLIDNLTKPKKPTDKKQDKEGGIKNW